MNPGLCAAWLTLSGLITDVSGVLSKSSNSTKVPRYAFLRHFVPAVPGDLLHAHFLVSLKLGLMLRSSVGMRPGGRITGAGQSYIEW